MSIAARSDETRRIKKLSVGLGPDDRLRREKKRVGERLIRARDYPKD